MYIVTQGMLHYVHILLTNTIINYAILSLLSYFWGVGVGTPLGHVCESEACSSN